MKVILSINAGSSSVKVSVYAAERTATPVQLAECQVSGLTAPPPRLRYSRAGERVVDREVAGLSLDSQSDALALMLQTLVDDAGLEEVGSKDDVGIACHRVVHGGDFSEPKVLSRETYHYLEKLSDLAPLHNGSALAIAEWCMEQLPAAVNVACFDSQFHATMPPHITTYAIDQRVAREKQLRKYGFHGLSYAFVARSVAEFLGKDLGQLNVIALHLGSGASVCAIRGGKSWDTSMGLTPLAGLPGATRSGSVDPSLVFHYTSNVDRLSPTSTDKLHISRAEEILNTQAGWKALTGTTEFGAIVDSDSPRHRLALDLFVDRICGFLGSYFVSLRGHVDAVVFAGGIGENSARLRAAVAEQASCLGIAVDEALNSDAGGDAGIVRDVGRSTARPRVLVCRTDEQLEMARACTEMETLWP